MLSDQSRSQCDESAWSWKGTQDTPSGAIRLSSHCWVELIAAACMFK